MLDKKPSVRSVRSLKRKGVDSKLLLMRKLEEELNSTLRREQKLRGRELRLASKLTLTTEQKFLLESVQRRSQILIRSLSSMMKMVIQWKEITAESLCKTTISCKILVRRRILFRFHQMKMIAHSM